MCALALIDKYNSAPGYFDDGDNTPVGGDPKKLATAFGASDSREALAEILKSEDYVFASERHEAIADALGLSSPFCCMGFNSVKAGGFPQGITKKDFVAVK